MKQEYIKGNEAIVKAALKSGVNGFFGYPITPASEIIEKFAEYYYNDRLLEEDGKELLFPEFEVFLQMESEIGAINAVLGGAATGKRVMTASSSPGISLKQEGISYIAASELPAVIVDIMRGGPGLGSITPEQSDYFQIVKGGGHGDYKLITLAPNSVQEMADLTALLFNLTDKYKTPGVLLADGFLGQMKENITFPELKTEKIDKSSWKIDGCKNRKKRVVSSIYLESDNLESHKKNLLKKYREIEDKEVRYEEYKTNDASVILVSYGIVSRVCKDAVDLAREGNINLGLLRPISLWPFPTKKISSLAERVDKFISVEMSFGQLVEDIKLSVNGKCDVDLCVRFGGNLPTEEEILNKI